MSSVRAPSTMMVGVSRVITAPTVGRAAAARPFRTPLPAGRFTMPMCEQFAVGSRRRIDFIWRRRDTNDVGSNGMIAAATRPAVTARPPTRAPAGWAAASNDVTVHEYATPWALNSIVFMVAMLGFFLSRSSNLYR